MRTLSLERVLGFGPLGGPEIVVILFLLGIPVVIVLVILFIVKKTQRPVLPPPAAMTAEQRLRELDALRAQHLISEEEYEAKRKEILGEV